MLVARRLVIRRDLKLAWSVRRDAGESDWLRSWRMMQLRAAREPTSRLTAQPGWLDKPGSGGSTITAGDFPGPQLRCITGTAVGDRHSTTAPGGRRIRGWHGAFFSIAWRTSRMAPNVTCIMSGAFYSHYSRCRNASRQIHVQDASATWKPLGNQCILNVATTRW